MQQQLEVISEGQLASLREIKAMPDEVLADLDDAKDEAA
jgi:hypothetical protein